MFVYVCVSVRVCVRGRRTGVGGGRTGVGGGRKGEKRERNSYKSFKRWLK